jgi:hypothetical protein
MTVMEWGALIALIAIAITLVSLVVLHVLPTGLSPFRDPVSQYGITRFRGGYAAAAVSAGIAGVGAIIVVAPLPGSLATMLLLGIFAVARILIPFSPMDVPGSPKTTRGGLHNVLAFLAFGAVIAAMFVAGGLLHDAGYITAGILSTVFGVIGAVGAVLLLVSRLRHRLRGIFGAAERLIYVAFIGWFIAVGVAAVVG